MFEALPALYSAIAGYDALNKLVSGGFCGRSRTRSRRSARGRSVWSACAPRTAQRCVQSDLGEIKLGGKESSLRRPPDDQVIISYHRAVRARASTASETYEGCSGCRRARVFSRGGGCSRSARMR